MTTPSFYYCAIPAKHWQENPEEEFSLAVLATDALNSERRIRKEINLEVERNRYTLICKRLENEVLLSGQMIVLSNLKEFPEKLKLGRFPAVACLQGYLQVVSQANERAAVDRMGASFFPPDTIESHRNQFREWAESQGLTTSEVVQHRLQFLSLAQKHKCGVVEIQASFFANESKSPRVDTVEGDRKEENYEYIKIPQFASNALDLAFFGKTGEKQHLFRILISQIRHALKHHEPICFGNQASHDIITEALNQFVFVPPGEKIQPINLRIMYVDGSEADPFPLFCLPQNTSPIPTFDTKPLKVALMSMRHLELDPQIDLCWFRNRDVSRTRTLAETDRYCFEISVEQLNESLRSGNLQIDLYHTGFEPAVVGFYRAVVGKLVQIEKSGKKNSLRVRPMYYRGGTNYQSGKFWY